MKKMFSLVLTLLIMISGSATFASADDSFGEKKEMSQLQGSWGGQITFEVTKSDGTKVNVYNTLLINTNFSGGFGAPSNKDVELRLYDQDYSWGGIYIDTASSTGVIGSLLNDVHYSDPEYTYVSLNSDAPYVMQFQEQGDLIRISGVFEGSKGETVKIVENNKLWPIKIKPAEYRGKATIGEKSVDIAYQHEYNSGTITLAYEDGTEDILELKNGIYESYYFSSGWMAYDLKYFNQAEVYLNGVRINAGFKMNANQIPWYADYLTLNAYDLAAYGIENFNCILQIPPQPIPELTTEVPDKALYIGNLDLKNSIDAKQVYTHMEKRQDEIKLLMTDEETSEITEYIFKKPYIFQDPWSNTIDYKYNIIAKGGDPGESELYVNGERTLPQNAFDYTVTFTFHEDKSVEISTVNLFSNDDLNSLSGILQFDSEIIDPVLLSAAFSGTAISNRGEYELSIAGSVSKELLTGETELTLEEILQQKIKITGKNLSTGAIRVMDQKTIEKMHVYVENGAIVKVYLVGRVQVGTGGKLDRYSATIDIV